MEYTTLLFIHVTSVILLLGVGGGSAFYKFMSDRSKNVEVIVHTNKLVVLADWLFTTPSVILQPISGFMLMNLMGYSLDTSWLYISVMLYIFSTLLWLVAVYLQIRMKNIALLAQKEKRALDEVYFRLVNYWIALGVFSALAMGGIFYLMVFKI